MKVKVVKYDNQWAMKFQEEAESIRDVFSEMLVAIHHIGSTAVPGLQAKPVIDMMPIVRDIEKVDSFQAQMQVLGYEALGEYGIKRRRFFRKGGENRTHHVHVFQFDHAVEIDRHLALRDYLRTNPKAAGEYGNLKAWLAAQHFENVEEYMDGKDAFVKDLEKRALLWYRCQ